MIGRKNTNLVAPSAPINYASLVKTLEMFANSLSNLRLFADQVMNLSRFDNLLVRDQADTLKYYHDAVVSTYRQYCMVADGFPHTLTINSLMQRIEQAYDNFIYQVEQGYISDHLFETLEHPTSALISIIGFYVEQLNTTTRQLNGEDVGQYFYPTRFAHILSQPENAKRFKAVRATETSSLTVFEGDLKNFNELCRAMRADMSKLQKSYIKIRRQVEGLKLLESNDEKIQKELAKSEGGLAKISEDIRRVYDVYWDKLAPIWERLSAQRFITDQMQQTAITYFRRFLSQRQENLMLALTFGVMAALWSQKMNDEFAALKGKGSLREPGDRRSSWYIGNADVYDAFKRFDEILGAAVQKFNTIRNGGGDYNLMDSIKDLSDQITTHMEPVIKFVSHDLVLDSAAGGLRLPESKKKLQMLWNRVVGIFRIYAGLFSRPDSSLADGVAEIISKLDEAIDALMHADDERSIFMNVKQFVGVSSRLNPALQKVMTTFRMKVETTMSEIQVGMAAASRLQAGWNELRSKYSELIDTVPGGEGEAFEALLINVPGLTIDPELNLRKISDWYQALQDKWKNVLAFAKFYTRVKGLYPFTIGLRSVDSRGRDVENLKYVEAMNALLSDALAGKSITGAKAELVREAQRFYPGDNRVIAANRMLDTQS